MIIILQQDSVQITLKPTDKVQVLRDNIQHYRFIPADMQQYEWKGQVIKDYNKTFGEYGILDEDTLTLKIVNPDDIEEPEGPTEFDGILQAALGTHKLTTREESKRILLLLIASVKLPGEEVSVETLTGADGKVMKPNHFCRHCGTLFGTEESENAIIPMDKLVRFPTCVLGGDSSHFYHLHCVMIKVCSGMYRRTENFEGVTWKVLPSVISQNFTIDKEANKLVCKDLECKACQQLAIKKNDNLITNSLGFPAPQLPWLTPFGQMGSRIIRPHFLEQDMTNVLPLFAPGDLIDCGGYRSDCLYVKLSDAQVQARQQNEPPEAPGEEWKKHVLQLEMDDYSYGLLPPSVIQEFGLARFQNNNSFRHALSADNWPNPSDSEPHA